ncbi:MAG: DUF484 family protein [Smithella sp.]|nr:DUF484 family protein [Smithella sp.]
MKKKENLEHINSKISSGFEKIERKLLEAKNVAGLFEILFEEIEKEFQVPFVWLTLSDNAKALPVAEALKSSEALKERLNLIKQEKFQEIFYSGLKPILVNKNLKPYYKLFPANQKYFVKSMAMVPFKIKGEVAACWNNGDSDQSRYAPDMETSLLQKLSHAVSKRLDDLI